MDEKKLETFIDGLKYHLNRILEDVERFGLKVRVVEKVQPCFLQFSLPPKAMGLLSV